MLVFSLASLAWFGVLEPSATITHPYRGVTLIVRTENSPRDLKLHIIQIDLATPGIRFKLTPPGGTRESVRQTTLDFLNQQHAQFAINAHFFAPFPSSDMNANLVGLAASEGIVYSPFEPQPVASGYANQAYAIVPYSPALNLDASNHAGIVHRDPAWPDNKHILEPVTLWNTVSGSAQIITDGIKTIPTYSRSANGLRSLSGYSATNSWYSVLRARSAIGLTKDRKTLILFTVDGTGGSRGMTPGEVADLLIKDYHVFNALNLDGGGSTTLALQDPFTHTGRVANISSDNRHGRSVGSNLAVFAAAFTEPVALLSITISNSNAVFVSWPSSSPPWKLQQTSSLNAAWHEANVVPERANSDMQFKIVPENTTRYYRLYAFSPAQK